MNASTNRDLDDGTDRFDRPAMSTGGSRSDTVRHRRLDGKGASQRLLSDPRER